ncbi:hypothetical protein HJC23_004569 [Cyclotella cryptica]|uniref:Nuclear nucleic acid-binding protein C1D n=1 Tax=Cyclotella cryptica TaxID=29204 RepID=A0ABD3QA85_9STRA|eukprot:CCRYP_007339-RA/>CCRYP_007339-RA protein AED:0.05 eAED:0.05 QI:37/1/1/1/0.5/0.33/3/285/173
MRKQDDESLAPLHKTIDALTKIRSALLPFLKLLKDDNSRRSQSAGLDGSPTKKRSKPDSDKSPNLDAHRRAEAEAAVALAIGTLRYMGARLRGLDEGRKKGDPLRVELDKIRAKLVELKQIESAANVVNEAKSETINSKDGVLEHDDMNTTTKRRKIIDTNASERMIKAALNG